MTQINRKYKDRLFRLIFGDERNKANTLALYNALNNSSYSNEDDLEITTLEDVIYIHMKNDLSFVIADSMNLYEQQASHNPNMPLRGFLYFANLYEKYLSKHNLTLHVNSLVKIPTPNYIVFYNGTSTRPAKETLLLSDAFVTSSKQGSFEWTANVINLNHSDNEQLLKKCKPLYDYTYLVGKIQMYQKTIPIKEAVDKAVEECITKDILAEFLIAHRAEVLQVYLAEVDEEVLRKNLKAEGYEEGFSNGFSNGFSEGDLARLTKQIEAKIKANKTLEQIADEVEMSVEEIHFLYDSLIEQMKSSRRR